MSIFKWLQIMLRGVKTWFLKDAAGAHPEIAYEGIIQAKLERKDNIQKAVARVHALMSRTRTERLKAERDLKETEQGISAAAKRSDKQVGALLIQKRDQLKALLADLVPRDEQLQRETKDLLSDVERFNREIIALKQEATTKSARYRSAQEMKRLYDQLDGLSYDTEDQMLQAVRDSVDTAISGLQVAQEISGRDLDRRVARVQDDARQDVAEDEFDRIAAELAQQQGVAAATVPSGDGSGGKTA